MKNNVKTSNINNICFSGQITFLRSQIDIKNEVKLKIKLLK